MSGAGAGLAGTVEGSFFKAPGWVQLDKPPGTTEQAVPAWSSWAYKVMTAQALLFSPNLLWLGASVLDYALFPYDLEEAKTWQWGWVLRRNTVNFGFMLLYYGFWHVSLYIARWSQRKFRSDTSPSLANMAHNIWYTCLGTLQWTGWEVLFLHCYATGKLGCVLDAEVLTSPAELAKTLVWVVAIPIWRGFHFYFCHRLIHVRVLYKYVHSLHHRNTDIEPFAGLAMHPVEHLYYFTCLAPSIYFRTSPFIMLWNGMHLLLSPAASHSGWEDHTQSDQFHYLHHAKFECNYGSASFPLDNWFGTFRDKMDGSASYKGEAADIKIKPAPFHPRSEVDFTVYMAITVVLAGLTVAAVLGYGDLNAHPELIAGTTAFGPIVIGLVLRQLFGDKMSVRWPFHKEPFFGGLHKSFGFNLSMGILVGVLPAYHFMLVVLGGDCRLCA